MSLVETEVRRTPLPLTSAPVHVAIALAVAIAIGAAWVATQRASGQAVQSATSNITRAPVYVTLPSVNVVARRQPVGAAPRPAS